MTPPDQPERERPEVDCPQGVHTGWAQRLREQLAAAERRRQGLAELRRQLAERRDAGLRARHATKLSRRNADRVTAEGVSERDRDQGPTTAEADIHIPVVNDRLRRAAAGGFRPKHTQENP